ncbi:hypothetical protein Dsin_017592 [Dipteronia sinensis]|uniref:K Homology domain-containing protein n=1 Tax=Dipteronia sinensis TaxID=43782 RepID=A0AAE0E6K2_9ROSI|nr:hypothetical protein Dsin_017592 [Dipteronia sinensis]
MMNNRSSVTAEPSQQRRGRQRREVEAAEQRWPGWPGQNVFRMIVPTASVGRILGNEGEIMKRICRETCASVRVFNRSQVPIPYTIVFIFGREEPEQEHSRAMLAATRVFRRATFFTTSVDDGFTSADAESCPCTARFLVHDDHVNFLTGSQENILNSIQEETGAVLSISSVAETMPYYPTEDELVIKIEGAAAMVVRAFESLLGQLRRFLVDRGVIQLFEQKYYEAMSRAVQSTNSGRSDPEPTTIHQQPANSSMDDLQMVRRIELPLIVVDRIIGYGETNNIEYICRNSNATIIVDHMSPCFDDMAVVKIIGTNSQISKAEHLIYSAYSDTIGFLVGRILLKVTEFNIHRATMAGLMN